MHEGERGANGTLPAIIGFIKKSADDSCRWSLRTDDLVRLTGLSVPDFYRTLYGLGRKVDFSDAVRGFSEANVGELVTLLEAVYGGVAADSFSSSGLFLPFENRIELTELYTLKIAGLQKTHVIQYDTFWSMVKVFRTFQKAFDVYVEEYFHPGALIDETAEAYRAEKQGDSFLRAESARYLRLLFERHVLSLPELFAWTRSRLEQSGFERGFFTARERTQYYDGQETGYTAGRNGDGREEEAMKLLGFPGKDFTKKDLRDRYRALIRKYHPDVNPSGLEMSKRLNEAYAYLTALCP